MAEIGEHERDISRVLEELAREDILNRLRTRDGSLDAPLERLRKNFYQLWKPLHELYLGEHADPILLEVWRLAPEGSQEWRKAREHDDAIELLMIATKG